jgi:pimeloyl-ACP methyl ester carboxylesterase
MRSLTALLVAAWLLTACTTGVTTAVPAHPPDARPHALPGYIRGSKESHADRVIVFIHGVFGDGTSTWTNPATGAYFPALIRDDKTFDGVDIWVHEFDTPKLRSTYTIDELADHLRKYLNNDNVIANHRQVIFVCHSLGGLVARAYLLKYRLPVSQVPMIYFFSTPTTGADVATLASFISANPQLTDMRKMTTDSPGMTGTWQGQWAASEYNHATLSYCGYETLPIHGVQIVQRESATNLCNTRFDPIRRDHIAIVKPTDNTSDESYIAFREAYRETFKRQTESTRPAAWNLASSDKPVVRVRNVTQTAYCEHTCWSDQGTSVAPGDDIVVDFSYRNAGFVTAKDARLRLDLPRVPLALLPITGSVTGTNVQPAFGSAMIAALGAPVLLNPTDAWGYDSDPTNHRMLSYAQTAASATTSEGLQLGDVTPDVTAHHVVLQFHCEPVTLSGTSDPEHLTQELAKTMTQLHAGTLPEAEVGQPLSVPIGHVEYDELGSNPAWVSDFMDINDDSVILLRLCHYNSSHETLRDLRAHASIEDVDTEHAKILLTITSRKGIERTATATLAYRHGTTRRPMLVGAWHGPKHLLRELATLHDGKSDTQLIEFPIVGTNDIQLGDLPPETLVSSIIEYDMFPEKDTYPLKQQPASEPAILNSTGSDWPLVQVSNQLNPAAWTENLAGFVPGQLLAVSMSFHNRSHALAKDVRLHLDTRITNDEIRMHATMTAPNAPTVLGDARASFNSAASGVRLYYDHALMYWEQAEVSRLVDALTITERGVEIGDLDPDEWGYLVVFFRSADRQDAPVPEFCDHGLLLERDPFEITATIRNDQQLPLRNVVLHFYVEALPNELRLTKVLTSAGKEIQRRECRLAARDVSLRYQEAYVYTSMMARTPRDASDAVTRGLSFGDIAPGTELFVRIRYEVIPSPRAETTSKDCRCTTADGRTAMPTSFRQ